MAFQSHETKEKGSGNYLCQQMTNANNDKLKVFDRLMSLMIGDRLRFKVTSTRMNTEVMCRSAGNSRSMHKRM